jgi:hypothetical protein
MIRVLQHMVQCLVSPFLSNDSKLIGLFNISYSDSEGKTPKKWTVPRFLNDVPSKSNQGYSLENRDEEEEIAFHLKKLNL